MKPVIKMFSDIAINDLAFIAGKNTLPSETSTTIPDKGLDVPNGFVVTGEAFKIFLKEKNLQLPLSKILGQLNTEGFPNIIKVGRAARQLILENELPHQLAAEIKNAHYTLCGEETNVSVTVRSTATTEDLPACDFTQQLGSFLNIRGEDSLVNAVQKCFASLFSDQAIYERHEEGLDDAHIAISIAVEKIVQDTFSSSNRAFPIYGDEVFDIASF